MWELVLLSAVIYVPWLQRAFDTFHMTWQDWLLVSGLAFTVVPVLETVKWMERRRWFGELA